MKGPDRAWWLALAAATIGAAALTAAEAGAEGLARERRAVPTFDRVALDAPLEVLVTQGAEETLAVEAEARMLPRLRTRVDDAGTLRIGLSGPVQTRLPLRVHLTLRTLRLLEASGAGDVAIGPLRAATLTIALDGSSSARIAALDAERLELTLKDASQLQVGGGAVRQLQARLGDAATLDAAALRSADARLHLTGSAQARVQATQRLDAVARDSASLRYAGAPPQLAQQLSGAADLLREPGPTP